jgi:hypothetical protein
VSSQDFSIRYPLFALKRDSDYVAYDLSLARPKGAGFGIPVFTTEVNVVTFLTHTGTQARIKRFDRVSVFRHFLRSIRDGGPVVLFDLLPDRKGNLHTDHVYPAAVVLERFLPEAAWVWGYPVYVLEYRDGFACVQAAHGGTPLKMLVVFTDWDLADRAVASAAEHLVAVPVADREAFARLVRGLAADVGGAVFDPPDPRRGGTAKTALLRRQLLADLEMEI